MQLKNHALVIHVDDKENGGAVPCKVLPLIRISRRTVLLIIIRRSTNKPVWAGSQLLHDLRLPISLYIPWRMISDDPARSYSRPMKCRRLFLRLSLLTEFDDATNDEKRKRKRGFEGTRDLKLLRFVDPRWTAV